MGRRRRGEEEKVRHCTEREAKQPPYQPLSDSE
jgi:hypothetical protein